MQKKFALLFILIVIIVSVIIFTLRYVNKPVPKIENPSATQSKILLHETLDCAALIAISEQMQNGSITPNSEAFTLISYALGKAQEYSVDSGGKPQDAKFEYDKKTLHYFNEYAKEPENNQLKNREKLTHCREKIFLLTPAEQIKTAIKTAREMTK